jgi:hypothetical protein
MRKTVAVTDIAMFLSAWWLARMYSRAKAGVVYKGAR